MQCRLRRQQAHGCFGLGQRQKRGDPRLQRRNAGADQRFGRGFKNGKASLLKIRQRAAHHGRSAMQMQLNNALARCDDQAVINDALVIAQ